MTDKQETAVTEQAERNYRKTRQGYVVSDKMDKTVVVEVEDRVKHALYGKVMRRSSKVKAHDERTTAPASATAFSSWRPARSRQRSVGASSRSSSAPSKPRGTRAAGKSTPVIGGAAISSSPHRRGGLSRFSRAPIGVRPLNVPQGSLRSGENQ